LVEIAVVPHGWVGGPRTFDAAGYGVAADSAGDVVYPAKAGFLDTSELRSWAEVLGATVTVRLANGVTTGG
jgi:hypothetical protein